MGGGNIDKRIEHRLSLVKINEEIREIDRELRTKINPFDRELWEHRLSLCSKVIWLFDEKAIHQKELEALGDE